MKKLKKGDSVLVIAGRDKGKRGVVRKVSQDKVVVDGINIVKKHIKPNPQLGIAGGIEDKEAFISTSNVSLYSDSEKRQIRVGFRLDGDKKIRFDKKTGKEI